MRKENFSMHFSKGLRVIGGLALGVPHRVHYRTGRASEISDEMRSNVQFIVLGRKRLIWGKMMRRTKQNRYAAIKRTMPRGTSINGTLVTPRTTYRLIATGGEMSENSNPVEQGPGRLAGEKDKKRQGERIDQFPLLH